MKFQAREPRLRLSPGDARAPWGAELERDADEALARAEDRLGLEIDAPPLIESIGPEAEFYRRLGRRPHNVSAVAFASENRVLINRDRVFSQPRDERMQTLVHEFSHLIVGRRIPGGVPRWLDEGLAMVVSGEDSFAYHTRVTVAATFGGLAPLDELFAGGADQELAYAQSLAVTRHLIQRNNATAGGAPDDPSPLARKLAHPERGRHLRELLRDRVYVRGLDAQWRASIRNLWTFIAALGSGGVLWGGASLLFLWAYWRKRKLAKAKEAAWEEEERAFPWLEAETTGESDEAAGSV